MSPPTRPRAARRPPALVPTRPGGVHLAQRRVIDFCTVHSAGCLPPGR